MTSPAARQAATNQASTLSANIPAREQRVSGPRAFQFVSTARRYNIDQLHAGLCRHHYAKVAYLCNQCVQPRFVVQASVEILHLYRGSTQRQPDSRSETEVSVDTPTSIMNENKKQVSKRKKAEKQGCRNRGPHTHGWTDGRTDGPAVQSCSAP